MIIDGPAVKRGEVVRWSFSIRGPLTFTGVEFRHPKGHRELFRILRRCHFRMVIDKTKALVDVDGPLALALRHPMAMAVAVESQQTIDLMLDSGVRRVWPDHQGRISVELCEADTKPWTADDLAHAAGFKPEGS